MTTKHFNIMIVGLAVLLVLGTAACANIVHKDLPFNQEPIQVSDTDEYIIYDTFSWNDGINSTITGSVDTLSMSKGNVWLKIGFGDPKTTGGRLVFYADSAGNRKAHLEFSPGSIDSNVVDLDAYTDTAWLYCFSITSNETAGAGYFDALIFGVTGTVSWNRPLTHNKTVDLTGAVNELFAAGIAIQQVGGPKAMLDATVSLVPEPSTLLLIGVGVGLLRRRRR